MSSHPTASACDIPFQYSGSSLTTWETQEQPNQTMPTNTTPNHPEKQ